MAARQIRWQAMDAALAALLTVAAVAEVTVAGYGPVTAVFAAAVTVALNWRRTYPLIVIAIGTGAWTVPILLGLVPSEAALTPLIADRGVLGGQARTSPPGGHRRRGRAGGIAGFRPADGAPGRG